MWAAIRDAKDRQTNRQIEKQTVFFSKNDNLKIQVHNK